MSKQQQAIKNFSPQPAAPSKGRWFYINIAIGVILILAGVGSLMWMGQQTATQKARASAASPAAQQASQTAPDFTLYSPTGQKISLNDYAGQVVLVNFWATWCPPCKAEMPAINKFYEAHKNEGFVVLAVNSQEDAMTTQNFIQAQGFSFPVLLDSQGGVMAQYNTRALPTTFIIDRSGVVQHVKSGAISYEELETIIRPLL